MLETVGIRFFVDVSVLVLNFIFVAIARFEFRNEEFPHATHALPHLVLASEEPSCLTDDEQDDDGQRRALWSGPANPGWEPAPAAEPVRVPAAARASAPMGLQVDLSQYSRRAPEVGAGRLPGED